MTDSEFLSKFTERLAHAMEKHPVFAVGKYHALGVIGEEFRELEHAILHESEERQVDEALDVAIVACRYALEEHKKHEN